MTPPAFVRTPATWYGYLLIATLIYLTNVQGNTLPFLQAEFALSYRAVSLHSTAIAVGVIAAGLLAERVARLFGRRRALWLGSGGLGAGALLLCIAPAAWISIGSCLLMGFFGGLLTSIVPAVMSDIHHENRGQAFTEQAIIAYTFAILGPLLTGFFVGNGMSWRLPVILGGLMGLSLVVLFRRVDLPERRVAMTTTRAALPPAFWAYWLLLTLSCALEFSVLLWAPTFLERVVGLSAATAATAAAGFFAGVLGGRIAMRVVLRLLAPQTILLIAFGAGFLGFALYWGVGTPAAAVVGIVLLGLCVAPLYPLSMALGIGTAAGANDAASARLAMGFGIAILLAPAALGALADLVGLSLAHLTLPGIIAAMLVTFITAGVLERRAILPAPRAFSIAGRMTICDRVLGQRPDVLVGDDAIRPDDERLRHAVNAPVDRAPPGLVGADRGVRVAHLGQKAQRVRRLVLVVDADDADAALRQFLKNRDARRGRARTTRQRR